MKDEQKNLKRELLRAQEEVKRIQARPAAVISTGTRSPRISVSAHGRSGRENSRPSTPKTSSRKPQSVPLVIGQFLEMVSANNGIVGSTTGSNYYVRTLSTLNR